MSDILITPIFEERREALHSRLLHLSGEQAVKQAESIVQEFLEECFGVQSEFKRKLPDPERFLINSVLVFSRSQVNLLTQDMPSVAPLPVAMSSLPEDSNYPSQIARDGIVALTAVVLASSGIGWGILGVAAGLAAGQAYRIVRKNRRTLKSSRKEPLSGAQPDMQKVADSVVGAIADICKCFDDILKTYRAQLFNAAQREEITFETQNRLLVSQIQIVLGAAYAANPKDTESVGDVIAECQQLEKMLSNEGLRIIKYSEQNKAEERFFQFSEHHDLLAPKMELPAIVRGDVAIFPGKVNIPKP